MSFSLDLFIDYNENQSLFLGKFLFFSRFLEFIEEHSTTFDSFKLNEQISSGYQQLKSCFP